jgi:hypothetical protein
MKHQNEAVQASATLAMSAISELVDCTQEVQAFVKEFQAKNASPTTQCSISRVLGALAYEKFGHGLDSTVACLIGGLTKGVSNSSIYLSPYLYCHYRAKTTVRWSKPGAIVSRPCLISSFA